MMRQRLRVLCLVLLAAALFGVPALAADDMLQMEEAEPGTVFQEGGFVGPQTCSGAPKPISGDEDLLYETIERGLVNGAEQIDVSSFQISREAGSESRLLLRKTYTAVLNDHPELFYYHSTYGFGTSDTTITSIFPVIIEEISDLDQAKAEFEDAVQRALSQVDGQMSDVEKLLVLHDYLILNCKYNYERHTGQPAPTQLIYRAYGALVNGDAVCNGYALAFRLLLNRLGIPNLNEGSNAMGHAWNLVQLDGEWYHMDLTWDDFRAEGGCRHKNFLVSDERFRETGHHDWEVLYTCGSTEYESGWIFNNSRSPVYRYNGRYYCVRPGSGVYVSEELHSEGTNVIQGQNVHININHGVAWHQDFLYYVFWDSASRLHTLAAIQLDSCKHIQLGRFERTEDHCIGLRYENDRIIPSNTDTVAGRIDLAGFPALPQQTDAVPVVKDVDDQFPLYYYGGRFYKVITERSGDGVLTRTTVSADSGLGSGGKNPDTLDRNVQMHPSRGIVWLDGYLYYADWGGGSGTETLMAFHLKSGRIVQAGQFDNPGGGEFSLRYDEDQRCIAAFSGETILASFSPLPEMAGSADGITVFDGGDAALVQADAAADAVTADQTVLIACYRGGQMIDVRQETLVKPQAYWLFGPLQLDAKVVSLRRDADQIRAFVLDPRYIPTRPAMTAEVSGSGRSGGRASAREIAAPLPAA